MMTSQTRGTLLERLRDGGDPLAWDDFFGRYWPMIYALARHRGCSEHTAEEVVQDVMLKVFHQRDVFQYDPQHGRFRDWLGTVVRNQVTDYRRRPAERVRPRGGDSEGNGADPVADDLSPDQAWEAVFENTMLMVLLEVVRRETNPRDYLAFELLTLHELPGTDVARITGLTRNVVYKARRKVFSRLRQLGGSYGRDGQLHEQVKQASRLLPPAHIERSVTDRVEKTMRSR